MLRQKLQKLSAIYRQGDAFALIRHLRSALITSVCDCQIQEVRGRIIADQDPVVARRENEIKLAIECSIVEAGDALEPFAAEFSLPFRDSFDALKQRLDQGCALILARRAQQNGAGNEVVAYSIVERGGFSAAGIKGKISKGILFIHHTEVAHKYRGQRIAQVLTGVMKEYCRNRGIMISCTAHRTGNIPSERAFRRFDSSRLLCHAVRLSFFRGLFVWHTSWRQIERAIASLDSRLERCEGGKTASGPGSSEAYDLAPAEKVIRHSGAPRS
jgi:predicted GNAT family acetyltransferase